MPVSRHIRPQHFGALIAGRVGVSVGAAISLRSPGSVAGRFGDLSVVFLDSLRLARVIGSRPHRFAAYFCILVDLWAQLLVSGTRGSRSRLPIGSSGSGSSNT